MGGVCTRVLPIYQHLKRVSILVHARVSRNTPAATFRNFTSCRSVNAPTGKFRFPTIRSYKEAPKIPLKISRIQSNHRRGIWTDQAWILYGILCPIFWNTDIPKNLSGSLAHSMLEQRRIGELHRVKRSKLLQKYNFCCQIFNTEIRS